MNIYTQIPLMLFKNYPTVHLTKFKKAKYNILMMLVTVTIHSFLETEETVK